MGRYALVIILVHCIESFHNSRRLDLHHRRLDSFAIAVLQAIRGRSSAARRAQRGLQVTAFEPSASDGSADAMINH